MTTPQLCTLSVDWVRSCIFDNASSFVGASVVPFGSGLRNRLSGCPHDLLVLDTTLHRATEEECLSGLAPSIRPSVYAYHRWATSTSEQ
jgi:hypothetical protein